jgi:hypothetical protein
MEESNARGIGMSKDASAECPIVLPGRDDAGYFEAFWTTLSPMSLILGYTEDGDFVVAADGKVCDVSESEYALKTVRLTRTMIIGCTGGTVFMRPVLSALGFKGVENSDDNRLFWDIEQSGQCLSMSHEQAWGRMNGVISSMSKEFSESEDGEDDERGLAAFLFGKKGGRHLRVTVWSRTNQWHPGEPDGLSAGSEGRMFLGYSPLGANHDEIWRIVSDRSGGETLEERLAKAIRRCAGLQSGPKRKINGNVFTRRMSDDGFTLRCDLDPGVVHGEEIMKRLSLLLREEGSHSPSSPSEPA